MLIIFGKHTNNNTWHSLYTVHLSPINLIKYRLAHSYFIVMLYLCQGIKFFFKLLNFDLYIIYIYTCYVLDTYWISYINSEIFTIVAHTIGP